MGKSCCQTVHLQESLPDKFYSFLLSFSVVFVYNNNNYRIKWNKYRILKSMHLSNYILFFSRLVYSPLFFLIAVLSIMGVKITFLQQFDTIYMIPIRFSDLKFIVTFFAQNVSQCDSEINTYLFENN